VRNGGYQAGLTRLLVHLYFGGGRRQAIPAARLGYLVLQETGAIRECD